MGIYNSSFILKQNATKCHKQPRNYVDALERQKRQINILHAPGFSSLRGYEQRLNKCYTSLIKTFPKCQYDRGNFTYLE